MKKTLLIVLILSAQRLLAQGSPPAPNRPEEPQQAQAQPTATAAPKPGHPLDPADVDVLTGKTKAPRNAGHVVEVSPYGYAGYAGYPVNVAQYSPSQFARVTTATQPPFVPLLFGRAGNRSFLLIGNTMNTEYLS